MGVESRTRKKCIKIFLNYSPKNIYQKNINHHHHHHRQHQHHHLNLLIILYLANLGWKSTVFIDSYIYEFFFWATKKTGHCIVLYTSNLVLIFLIGRTGSIWLRWWESVGLILWWEKSGRTIWLILYCTS